MKRNLLETIDVTVKIFIKNMKDINKQEKHLL